MIYFDFPRQPLPWLSEVPEDKDMSMETCSGNAKSRFCRDIAYLFQNENVETGRGNNRKERKPNFHTLFAKDEPREWG